MSSEFKQQLRSQMHAREVSSFGSWWSRYLKFVTAVQRAVHSGGDSSSDVAAKDGKKKLRSLKHIPVGEQKKPKDMFPTSLLTKDSEWSENKGDCVFRLQQCTVPLWGQVFPQPCQTPNRRRRQPQWTVRTHPKYKRSKPRCANCLHRRTDCSKRKRSPSSSAAAAARMMILTRHLHCVRIAPPTAHAAQVLGIEGNSIWHSSAWFNSAQPNLAQLNLVQLSTTQLGSTQLGPTLLNSTQLNLAQLHLELKIN